MRSAQRFRASWHWAMLLAILLIPGIWPGRGEKVSAQLQTEEETAADRLRQMRTGAKTFTVVAAKGSQAPVGAAAEPIFRYNEPARGFLDGTIWAFGSRGRPQAALKLEIHATGVVYGLVSFAPETLSARGVSGWRWSSTQPGLKLAPIPGAPAPAQTGRERQLQMKALARRFSAIEDDGPVHGKFTLRLLTQPIHQYTDPAANLLDGAIFGFATGTNPDLLLLVEATQAPGAAASWQYAFARIGGADLSGRLDGTVVWHGAVAGVPSQLATYANFTGPRTDLQP